MSTNVATTTHTAAGRPPTSQLFSRGNLVSSRNAGDKSVVARPSTAVRAVGYVPSTSGSARFDQFFLEKVKQQTLSSANATVNAEKNVNPQIKYKNMETKILKLLESSIAIAAQCSPVRTSTSNNPEEKSLLAEALNKARDASSLDRILHHEQDKQGENVHHNYELTYAVFFNLAEQYGHNEMHIEALNTYNIMTKNKMFPHVNQLKLNMGNIYLKMGMHKRAIKMYRMALDSVPNTQKQLRLKITENIGVLFVRMGQYADAASSYEFIMSEKADIRCGIYLLLCYYALGDVEKLKSTFRNLCDVQPVESERDLENDNNIIRFQQHTEHPSKLGPNRDQGGENHAEVGTVDSDGLRSYNQMHQQNKSDANLKNQYVAQALQTDELAVYTKNRRNAEKRSITMIIDLISPLIEENYNDGYNWCIEVIKSSNLSWLVNELELNRALVYLRQNDINQAIEMLQTYDRKSESSMTASALTNLSFIYINLGNIEMGTHCMNKLQEEGTLQLSPLALVNASILDIENQNLILAKERLQKALLVNPTNFEANYNLGLLYMQEQNFDKAEEQFGLLRAQLIEPHSMQHCHVYYQLAKLQERRIFNASTVDFKASVTSTALQAYLQVLGISATDIDSQLYEKVGSIYEQRMDYLEANQYYNEAYRINMSDIGIASSIGSYYIKLQATEKALYYYERAVLADPNDPNLMLRIASCFRNSYLPPKQYLSMFEKIYLRFPDNLICVRALMHVTKTLGMSELHEQYVHEYLRLQKQKLERQNELRYQQQLLFSTANSSRIRTLRIANEDRLEENIRMSNMSTHNDGQFIQSTNAYFVKHHVDPLGPSAERPRTGKYQTQHINDSDDDAEISAESLLPI